MEHSHLNPWIAIWRQPRNTIQTIISTHPTYGTLTLVLLTASLLAATYLETLFFDPGMWSVILFSSIVLAFLGLYLLSWTLYWPGKIVLGGQATTKQIRAAIAWSYPPIILGLLLLALAGAMGFSFWQSDIDATNTLLDNFALLSALIALGCVTWGFVLHCILLSQVQQFSTSRAMVNVTLSASIWIVTGSIISLSIFLILFLFVGSATPLVFTSAFLSAILV